MSTRVLVFCSAVCTLQPSEVDFLRKHFNAELRGTRPQSEADQLSVCEELKPVTVYVPLSVREFFPMYQSILTEQVLRTPHYMKQSSGLVRLQSQRQIRKTPIRSPHGIRMTSILADA